MNRFEARMHAAFGPGRMQSAVALGPLTTFKVGGPAEWLLDVSGSDEIVRALRIAHDEGVPVTVLGSGSNVLISDAGVRGLVLRPRGGAITRLDERRIRADAGVTINELVRWTVARGCAGLEAWAGTPGTVGGAIAGNAHFGGRLIGDLVIEVRTASRAGQTTDLTAEAMAFGYDRSRLQHTGETVLSAVFRVTTGDPAALRTVARQSLAHRKRTQPLSAPSAGCVFQNPDPSRDRVPQGMAWSAGALIEGAGMRGAALGGARVSPMHGNFIVNEGTATAHDIRTLVERCRAAVRTRYGVELREEIVYLGNFAEPGV